MASNQHAALHFSCLLRSARLDGSNYMKRNACRGARSVPPPIHSSRATIVMARRAVVMVLAAALAVLLHAAASLAPVASVALDDPAVATIAVSSHHDQKQDIGGGGRWVHGRHRREDECMIMRTLVEQTDTVYTQQHK